ncbi:uncharacterized protein BHQ10_005836 [Talaromyces amestolkiae]|uniref:pectinesterase n=1 Tax=Talaromyces amestolkiae TaxID=1196081 RepID=A0A364L219_TALAM|nr:uncharacterized protein BHQ10_005836 [Talaromyces amestolkiae]RAO69824.1 hypothetical protein BHQ10_005836 [Talaromyces amestolkiae]
MNHFSLIAFACTWLLQTQVTSSLPTSNLEKRTARTSPPSGCLVVRGSGTQSGEYSTLSAAVTALGSSTANTCIFIYSGTYNEALRIAYGGALTFYGEQKYNTVTITRNESSTEAGNLDDSSAVNVVSSNFRAYNINFSNKHGQGAQAVALTANGDQQGYYACGFYGYQDTLYAKA